MTLSWSGRRIEIPPFVQRELDKMSRRRRGAFTNYIINSINCDLFCKILKLDTFSDTYQIPKKISKSIQGMPLSAMIKKCEIIKVRKINKLDYGRTMYGMEIQGRIESYKIFSEIYKLNNKKLWSNTRGFSLSTEEWRYQNIYKQKMKVKQKLELIRNLSNKSRNYRSLYRDWIINKLFKGIKLTKRRTRSLNLYKYAREHSKSKWQSGIRWGSLSLDECYVIAWVHEKAIDVLEDMIKKLGINETLVWDLDIGFDAIRTRSEINQLEKDMITEEYYYSRDARSLGWLSHLFGNLRKETIRMMEAEIITKFAKISGLKVMTPFLNNTEMWRELSNHSSKWYGYDGSNWQSVVGIILGSPISLIFYGWVLLCSGSNTTSLEGILTMIIVIGFHWLDVYEICAFGDDVMVDYNMQSGEKDFISRDELTHEKTMLGYNIESKRSMGLKICRDDSEKMQSYKSWDEVRWMENKPDINQKIALIIAYGFSEVTNPIQLNINSEEYLKISRLISSIQDKMWNEVKDEFKSKHYDEWWK